MSNTNKIIIAIIAVIVIAGGVWALTSTKDTTAPAATGNNNSSQSSSNDSEVAATITYGNDGFSPSTTTVKSDQKVKIVNQTNEVIEFASDPHPTHTINPELNTNDIAPNGSAVITVTKKGSWGYHNHYDPSKTGRLIVE